MHAIRRSCAAGVGGPRRAFSSWAGLGAFVESHSQSAWQTLRQSEQQVASTVKKAEEAAARTPEIDWNKWENAIAHKDIVKQLRAHYEQQASILSSLASLGASERAARIASLGRGWNLFENALAACEASVKKSEDLLTNGASALWVSYHNPPVTKLDTNEWLDTDPYWQAFVEKHFFYAQYQPGVEDPESPVSISSRGSSRSSNVRHSSSSSNRSSSRSISNTVSSSRSPSNSSSSSSKSSCVSLSQAEREKTKASWHVRVGKFNDRSDTPMLYNFMETLPSWEYYDIHRRAFLEHMVYFLVRKGTDFRFFPEITPWQWLGDIEDQRFKYVSVAQRRRAHMQLASLSREKALDLLPVDVEHDGADATLRFLQREAEATSAAVSRLMASFSFLCDPFIPCSSTRAALLAMQQDGGRGSWFDLGEDVHALFYLPHRSSRRIPKPREAFHKILDHLTMTGKRMNPSYATLLDSFSDVLEKRGENWFCAEGECASQAFLRRLREDDPARDVYCDYFEEMYSRFNNAKELNTAEMLEKMSEKEQKQAAENEVYALSTVASSADTAAAAQEQAGKLNSLFRSKQLQPVMDAGGLVVLDANGNKIKDAQTLIASFAEFESKKDLFLESLKTVKEGAAGQKA